LKTCAPKDECSLLKKVCIKNNCVKKANKVDCEPPKKIVGDKCITTTPTHCQPGYKLNAAGKCFMVIRISITTKCKKGEIKKNGKCIIHVPVICDTKNGYTFDKKKGKCIKTKKEPVQCSEGYVLKDGKCI